MKIAIIGIRGIPANYGGFETCAEHTAKYWTEHGNDVIVYCRINAYKNRRRLYNACRLIYVFSLSNKSFDTLSHTFFSILHLLIFQRQITHVHLYNGGNALFLPLLKLAGKKVIISVDGLEWKRGKWGMLARHVHLAGERMATLFADAIIADNAAVEKYYYSRYKSAKVITIPYGAKVPVCDDLDYQKYVLAKHSLNNKEYFLFVGRLVPEKGVHRLIEAYTMLDTSFPLVIIGDDRADSNYRNQLLKSKSDKIRFLGYLYGKEYEYLLKNALIYVSASDIEGTSPSLLAALGAGVCALVNGIEENKCTLGNAGFYFKENDVADLYRVWKMLIENPSQIDEMTQKGFDYATQNYSWGSVSEAYLRLFKELA